MPNVTYYLEQITIPLIAQQRRAPKLLWLDTSIWIKLHTIPQYVFGPVMPPGFQEDDLNPYPT